MSSFQHISHFNPGTKNVTESGFNFDEDMFNNFEDGSNLDGYLQTEKYFKHIEDEIREDFTFKDEILEPCNEFISNFENILFLHVRRGDNVGRENFHPVMTFEYYERALKNFLMVPMFWYVLMILSGVLNKTSSVTIGSSSTLMYLNTNTNVWKVMVSIVSLKFHTLTCV